MAKVAQYGMGPGRRELSGDGHAAAGWEGSPRVPRMMVPNWALWGTASPPPNDGRADGAGRDEQAAEGRRRRRPPRPARRFQDARRFVRRWWRSCRHWSVGGDVGHEPQPVESESPGDGSQHDGDRNDGPGGPVMPTLATASIRRRRVPGTPNGIAEPDRRRTLAARPPLWRRAVGRSTPLCWPRPRG